jgi:hypothetical protein
MMRLQSQHALNVGLLIDGFIQPAWIRLMLARLRAAPFARLALVVLDPARGERSASGLAAKTRSALRAWAVDAQRAPPDAFALVDVSDLVADIPRVDAAHSSSGGTQYSGPVLDRIASQGLDVLLALGSLVPSGRILDCARHGLWSFAAAPQPEGFAELAAQSPTIRSALELVTASGRKTLYESSSCVDPICLATNRNRAYWKAASFVPRTLALLQREGAEAFARRVDQLPVTQPRAQPPSSAALAKFLGTRWIERRHARALEILTREQWILLYAFGDGPREDYESFTRLVPPPDRFWADPHLVVRDGRYYVFLEEYLYATHRAHLSVLVLGRDGKHESPVPIIERPYHLSYPHIVSWRGELYLIPESKGNRTVEAYRCKRFPYEWELAAVLMENVDVVDSTLIEHGGRWWLFANVVETEGVSSWDELFLYSADSPLSTRWTPHPQNPIVSDVTRSRPAGPLFRRDGRLYRPSQNSALRYGFGFNINEVIELSATHYDERVVKRVEPNWDPEIYATHTFCSEHGLTVIDGMRRFWRRR